MPGWPLFPYSDLPVRISLSRSYPQMCPDARGRLPAPVMAPLHHSYGSLPLWTVGPAQTLNMEATFTADWGTDEEKIGRESLS